MTEEEARANLRKKNPTARRDQVEALKVRVATLEGLGGSSDNSESLEVLTEAISKIDGILLKQESQDSIIEELKGNYSEMTVLSDTLIEKVGILENIVKEKDSEIELLKNESKEEDLPVDPVETEKDEETPTPIEESEVGKCQDETKEA